MAKSRKRPNVLLITCDQWRGDCLSAAGHPVGEDAERRRAGRRRRAVPPALCRRGALLAGARLPLHRPLPDEQSRLPQRHAARRAARQHRAGRASLGYDPTLFGYTDVVAGSALPMRRAIRCCEAMKACCRASPCASFCPSTRSHGSPGSRRAASIRAPAFPDIHRPADSAPARRHQRARRSIRGTRRRPPSWPANSSAGWASRNGRALVRAYLLPQPASALHRAGTLQHDVRPG